jgi:hypothetical protein
VQNTPLKCCSQEAVNHDEIAQECNRQELCPSLGGFLKEGWGVLDHLVDRHVHEEVDGDGVGLGRSTRHILLVHIKVASGVQIFDGVHKIPCTLLLQNVSQLIFWPESDVSLNLTEAKVFSLNEVQGSLS